jgi:undecaprenyl-diphosphatase
VQIKIVVFGLACATVSYLIALLAGQLYFDPRPFVVGHFKPLIEHDTENGFPSDHVLLVATVAAVVTVFDKKIALLLCGFTIVIAIARVYVGVHHIIDVVTSMFIAGAVTALIYYFFSKRLHLKTKNF